MLQSLWTVITKVFVVVQFVPVPGLILFIIPLIITVKTEISTELFVETVKVFAVLPL